MQFADGLFQESGRVTKDGYLIVTSEKTRRQHLNQADAVDKLCSMVQAADDDQPYEPTAEQLAILQRRCITNVFSVAKAWSGKNVMEFQLQIYTVSPKKHPRHFRL